MLVLLSYDSEQSTATITNLLNNQEVIKSISTFLPPQKTNQVGDITVNHLSVTMQLNEEDSYEQYIGYVKEIIEENYLINHLKHPTKSVENVWKRINFRIWC